MGNNGVRNIVLLVILVVMSFFLGIQASDGAKTPIMVIGILVGIFGLLYMGERAWMLPYLLPPFLPVIGLSAPNLEMRSIVACCIFGYWILMRVMGYVRMRWQGQILIDSVFTIIVIYMMVTFYRRPAAIGALDFGFETIGGKAYVFALTCCLGYIGCSLIPMGYERMTKISKYLFYVTFVCLILEILNTVLLGRTTADSEYSSLMEEAQNSRFSLIAPLGLFLFYYIYGSIPFVKILTSPKHLLILILSFVSILLSGWRSKLLFFVLSTGFLAFIKKELSALILGAAAVYGALLFLSHEHMLEELPYGMQRSLSAVPGHLNVDESIRRGAEGSTKWRQVMWNWALDPRTRYIHNYIWGDGPGDDAKEIARGVVAASRGTLQAGDQRFFAARGTWHSGWITVMHRLGLVGLGIFVSFQILMIFFTLYVLFLYRNTETYKYLPPLIISLPGACIGFHISAGSVTSFFIDVYTFCFVKLLYCAAREQGMVPDIFRQKDYIPLTIRDIEKQAHPQQVG